MSERQGRSEAIELVLRIAAEIGPDHENGLLSAVAMWLLREGHLAVERAHTAMASGVPEDTAWFVAIDDMGFQIAHGAARGWVTSKRVDQTR